VKVPVKAGSIVVFTSLTPHATKANVTGEVRKAYIVQYAPEGAVACFGKPSAGPPTRRDPLGDDERRYWVVRNGERVSPPSLAR
jgi:phytanoyl-CoA hydroxylase